MQKQRPDFILCGVQKCGTTSLQQYLSQNNEISFQPGGEAEIHFFDNPDNYKKGEAEFIKHFKEANPNQLIGQATSTYIYDYIPERIYNFAPDAKLVFILRNPAERAYSHFWHAKSKSREELSFTHALAAEKRRIEKDYWNLINYSYFQTGLYMKMVNHFLKLFKREQIHFVFLEELKTDKLNELNKIFDFLGVKKMSSLRTEKAYNQTKISKFKFIGQILNNKLTRTSKILFPLFLLNNKLFSKKYPKLEAQQKQKLLQKYNSDIVELESFLGKDLSFWKQ